MNVTSSDPTARQRPTDAPLLAFLSNATWPVLPVVGVAAIVMGVLVLVWPGPSLLVVGVLFGIYLLVTGVFEIVEAFAPHVPGSMRALNLIAGALSVVLGLICFRGAAESLLLLAFWIGFGWLLRGTSLVAVGISARRGWLVFVGAVTILGGIVLVVSPATSILTLTLLAGIWLVVIGVMEVVHGVLWYVQERRHRQAAAATG
ncbi:MAG TPA: HdeD family acid-resistance protein [Pseudonocardiaceae bacterium]|nr:HdeD family acid-resistance protein [Pseudonocardiaceae bacterium]